MSSPQNRYAAASSTHSDLDSAVDECIEAICIKGLNPNLVLLFWADHTDDVKIDNALRTVRRSFPNAKLAGCNCAATLANHLELESGQALTMWCAEMPSAQIEVFHLHYQRTSEGAAFAGFPSRFELQERKALDTSLLLAIGDPYTFPMDLFLNRTNEDHPGLRVMGGMGSAASRPGDSRLLCDDQCVNHGAVFVFIEGPTTIATVVSQGCRPIGEPLVITRADRNMIEELGGKPAYDRLANLYNTLPTQEQRLVQQALHLGVAMSEFRESFGYGDFLIRNVVATDGEAKTIQVGDFVKIGQTVQFHIRDHESASSDLKQRLKTSRQEHAPLEPSAALVFTCNGRGVNLFPEENHDAQMVQEILGEIPAGGFFAAGEIGPIVEQNFVHGFTCCVVWFC